MFDPATGLFTGKGIRHAGAGALQTTSPTTFQGIVIRRNYGDTEGIGVGYFPRSASDTAPAPESGRVTVEAR